MAPPSPSEIDAIRSQTWKDITGTPYECSTLTLLSGGSANFVFRGDLVAPASCDPYGTVIVKQFKNFLACSSDFEIDLSRFHAEASMLQALGRLTGLPFRAPKLYYLDLSAKIQVHESYWHDCMSIADYFRSRSPKVSPNSIARTFGRQTGEVIRTLHDWASLPVQQALRDEIWKNGPMRKLKYQTTYASFIQVLERLPGLVNPVRDILEEVRDMGLSDLERQPTDIEPLEWGMIHGDFWAGNILSTGLHELAVIDWELVQFGHRSYDLGQLVGDLYERQWLDHHQQDDTRLMIARIGSGYGRMSEDMVYRTATHAGVHLIHAFNRRRADVEALGPEKALQIMTYGRELVIRGYTRDKPWLESQGFDTWLTYVPS
ncbi:hypothetical protein OQA88_6996 [Cercophora sp. LCS_1]